MEDVEKLLIILLSLLAGFLISRALRSNGKGGYILRRIVGRLPGDTRREKRAEEE